MLNYTHTMITYCLDARQGKADILQTVDLNTINYLEEKTDMIH